MRPLFKSVFAVSAPAIVLALIALTGCGAQPKAAPGAGTPLLTEGSEIDLIRVSEAVWAREAAVGVQGLSDAERTFLCVWNLEAEVNNGGFSQFYINSAGDNALETPAALREIGAERMAAIAEEANSIFGASGPPRDRDERTRALEQKGKEVIDVLGALDGRFFEYPDNLSDLLRQFVDSNREQFKAPV